MTRSIRCCARISSDDKSVQAVLLRLRRVCGFGGVLKNRQPKEIVACDLLFHGETDALYTVDHWGPACLINGSASDDGFYYFRC
jgi:hypothetical protein